MEDASPPLETPPQFRFSRIKARLTCPLHRLFSLDHILSRLSRSPLTISYVLLIPTLVTLGMQTFTRHYDGPGNSAPELLLVVIAAALAQPTGSLLLAPATQPGRFYRINPLVCMGETLSLIFGLLRLRYATHKQFSWAAAAQVLVLEREVVGMTREQVQEVSGEDSCKRLSYKKMREEMGFPPLRTRGLDQSAAVSIVVLALLAWLWAVGQIKEGIRLLGMLFVLSLAALQGTILIASTRTLTTEEESSIEDELREYFLEYSLQSADTNAPDSKHGVDESVKRLASLIALCWIVGGVYCWQWVMDWDRIAYIWGLVVVLPAMEILCFALLRAASLGGRESDWIHLTVLVAAFCVYLYG